MEDVSVELSVRVPCGAGSCSRQAMTKTILMWSGMVPVIGDQIDTAFEANKMRLHVVGRLWQNRGLTLFCKPVQKWSRQALIECGFSE